MHRSCWLEQFLSASSPRAAPISMSQKVPISWVVKQDGEALSICIQVDAPDTVKQENNTAQPLTSDV